MQPTSRHSAFTLIELLVVISIIGILTAITLPTLSSIRRADSLLAGTRQLLDDVARARQLAIANHTTVYMVFVPASFWANPTYNNLANPGYANLPQTEKDKAARLFDKQFTAYAFVSLRSAGDQPGQTTPRYLSRWQPLPEGAIIPQFKFNPPNSYTRIQNPDPNLSQFFDVYGFSVTNAIPFPSEEAALYPAARPYVPLPYIAFNYLGQLESGADEFIPLARGSVGYARDESKTALAQPPTVTEQPPGNSINAFTLIHIDWLTGRARVQRQELR